MYVAHKIFMVNNWNVGTQSNTLIGLGINQLPVDSHPGPLPEHFKCRVENNQYLLLLVLKKEQTVCVRQFILCFSFTQIQLPFALIQLSCVTVRLCSNHCQYFVLMQHCCVAIALCSNCFCHCCFYFDVVMLCDSQSL